MPHVVIKMFPGRTPEQKDKLSRMITQAVMESIGVAETSISIAVEEVPREEWVERVFKPEIEGKADTLLKKPAYGIEVFEK
ncbi:tautomerase family protein [Thermoclostridium caenicola]|uniref:4-oxalocrotonate tautomerase n=1 Tax=Thermoclostridium caenicola TaxID=659425 RepID=A0A1M6EHR2_9FIRM|nr:tautomerase family protein [Thermoclostridium caenicola]SHI84971.1 4-oxalocrotonate tautomerase [Thermoclostridium caenicola]HOL84940.1 tautomerase family protein [Thermoclostridium caenicola]HOP72960.1 tautomerase family protein [Thermoclostridium caenicola]HPO77068.1 tautomerase family protein [Thermoclostridium caenicola]